LTSLAWLESLSSLGESLREKTADILERLEKKIRGRRSREGGLLWDFLKRS
jgi:hypothetical protein